LIMNTILVVEDDIDIRELERYTLASNGYAVLQAEHGKQALEVLSSQSVDLIILDIMMPVMDGLTLIKTLRYGLNNTTPIIVVSAKGEESDIITALELGADDYLTKPFSFSELLARVRALIRRASKLSNPSTLVVADLTMNLQTRKVKRAEREIDLQPLEFSLLEYLMRNTGQVVSKTMIMEHVWDYSFNPGTNVVESKICYLRDKIDKSFQKKLIHTIRGVGYVLQEDA